MELGTWQHSETTIALPPRIRHLFLEGAAWNTDGYAKHALGLLRSETLLKWAGATAAARLKAPSQLILDRVMGRMRCWAKLAEEVCHAEFPAHTIFCAFEVFHLNAAGDSVRSGAADVSDSIARLAQIFNVDEHQLFHQLEKHRPIAQTVASATKCGPREAWSTAVAKTQRHTDTARSYSVSALRPVLTRYLAWSISTSGIEQNFSKAERAGAPAASSLRHELTCYRALLSKCTSLERDAICRQAQELYAECSGRCSRKHVVPRIDKGHKRPTKDAMSGPKSSEVNWLKRRRASISESLAAAAAGGSGSAADLDDLPGWFESHNRELAFQKSKQKKRKIEAFLDQALLPKEIDEELQAEAVARQAKDAVADKGLVRKAAKKQALASMTCRRLEIPARSKVWIDSGLVDDTEVPTVYFIMLLNFDIRACPKFAGLPPLHRVRSGAGAGSHKGKRRSFHCSRCVCAWRAESSLRCSSWRQSL